MLCIQVTDFCQLIVLWLWLILMFLRMPIIMTAFFLYQAYEVDICM